MFGWRLISDRELELKTLLHTTQIAALTGKWRDAEDYAEKCERLLDHERERIDAERERADRIADSLFQSNGLPPTSATVVREQQAAEQVAAGKRTDYMKELMEIYGESVDELVEDGAEPVPEELAEIVK